MSSNKPPGLSGSITKAGSRIITSLSVDRLPSLRTLVESLKMDPKFIVVPANSEEHSISLLHPFARGATSSIHLATLDRERQVVAKKFVDGEFSDEMRAEIFVHKRLNHPNIVKFIGYSEIPQCLLLEYLSYGDLASFLCNRPNEMYWQLLLAMALDSASGLSYLHQQHIIHRDFKSGNLLVASLDPLSQPTIKLADFGESYISSSDYSATNEDIRLGTIRYASPEVLSGSEHSEASDVFSFAVILWELFFRKTPYHEIKRNFCVQDAVIAGSRPSFDEIPCPPSFKILITQCWDASPSERPNIDTVHQILLDIQVSTRNQHVSLPIAYSHLRGSH